MCSWLWSTSLFHKQPLKLFKSSPILVFHNSRSLYVYSKVLTNCRWVNDELTCVSPGNYYRWYGLMTLIIIRSRVNKPPSQIEYFYRGQHLKHRTRTRPSASTVWAFVSWGAHWLAGSPEKEIIQWYDAELIGSELKKIKIETFKDLVEVLELLLQFNSILLDSV